MLETVLFFVLGTLLLVFGVCLSAAFAGIKMNMKNALSFLVLCIICGVLQIAVIWVYGETAVWELYPVITHIPLLVFICLRYHKRPVTTIAAICSAYLCCQPAKWAGIVAWNFSHNMSIELAVRCIMLIVIGIIVLNYFAQYIAEIFNKDTRSVCIFGLVPVIYYLFDYATVVYTDLWTDNNRIAAEFLPLLLGIIYMIFCIVYYKEYEQKADAQRAEQIIRIAARQHEKEMDALKRSEKEVRLLRHDMRLLLSSIALCIENSEPEKAGELIDAYVSRIENTKIKRYCKAELLNYVFSDFAARSEANGIEFRCSVETDEIGTDEMMLSSILSNALDNALNAQMNLAAGEREIEVAMRTINGKLLISIQNPTHIVPVFADGLPVTNRDGHGYGTQSIRYMTERLGGKCQFTAQGKRFIVRIVI